MDCPVSFLPTTVLPRDKDEHRSAYRLNSKSITPEDGSETLWNLSAPHLSLPIVLYIAACKTVVTSVVSLLCGRTGCLQSRSKLVHVSYTCIQFCSESQLARRRDEPIRMGHGRTKLKQRTGEETDTKPRRDERGIHPR